MAPVDADEPLFAGLADAELIDRHARLLADPFELVDRGEVVPAGLAFHHLEIPAPDRTLFGGARHLDVVGGADKRAGAAADADLALLLERRPDDFFGAAVGEPDRAHADDLLAGADAHAAENAGVVGLVRLETGLGLNPHFGGHVLEHLRFRAARHLELQDDLADVLHPVGLRLDFDALGDRVQAGRHDPRPLALLHLDHAHPAGAGGLDRLVPAQGRDPDPVFAGDVQQVRALFRLNFFSVDCEFYSIHF